MTELDLLAQLVDACQCGVFVTVNEHRDYYQTAEAYLKECDERECPCEIAAGIRAEMIKRNVIVHVQAYPSTPIGSYSVMHWDLETALRTLLDAVRRNRKETS